MSEEKRYTLEEAKLELNKAECARYGHQWDVILSGGDEPLRISCRRCGRSWPVGKEEKS